MPVGSVGVPSALLNLLTPIPKGSIFNTAVGANTNFFVANLIPTNTPTKFQIYVCLSAAGVFNIQRRLGAVTQTENLNKTSLKPNTAYRFDVPVDASETINLQTTVAATIIKCSVVEKDSME